ncbi:PREDICTED: uncharacterized protein LOC104818136 [Tarenaya hassleriana]|uniref:uncharacterized protein LOC104818136 n=1 Tax=Tarenaya hassleriana TaxID=28532 RepID=UPI00053C6FA6|nr:PREDICTED: uncharacterized protein LOC104818136 [Tarenaya hassleriana]
MATALFYATSSSDLHRLRHRSVPSSPFFSPSTSPLFPPPSRLHRQTLLVAAPGSARCLAVAPGPPSPPGPGPPPPRNTNNLGGIARTISTIEDRVKIFFAVLFWMSLFFWASVSDGRGEGKRKKKGSPFK